MGHITVHPGKLAGAVTIPASKSLAHRAIICAALAKGESSIAHLDRSADIDATIGGMAALGADFSPKADKICGNKKKTAAETTIDCNESGSTLRFLVPIALALGQKTRFLMRGQLGKRPLEPYYEIFQRQGIDYHHNGETLTVFGQLKPGTFAVDGGISSQFISGLLFSLPLLPGDSRIEIKGALESREYITLTIAVLRAFGIDIHWPKTDTIKIIGGQTYRPTRYEVEGDYSQAAFFLCANALGSSITLKNLRQDSAQGDKAIREILALMGSKTYFDGEGLKTIPGPVRSTRIDAAQCPDLIPVLAGLAGFAAGETEIFNGARLRLKECDRLQASHEELAKLGIAIEERPQGLMITGKSGIPGGTTAWSHKDHRIAMTLAIAATACQGPVTIEDHGAVEKSYPRFFADFQSLGGKLT